MLAIDLSGSTVPVFLNVWQGDSLTGLQIIQYGNSSGTGPYDLVFRVKANATYRFQAGSTFPNPNGLVDLRVVAGQPPPNDQFQGTLIAAFPFEDTVDTTFATVDPGEAALFGEATLFGATVWYYTAAPAEGFVIADVRASDFPSRIAVYAKDFLDDDIAWRCGEVVAVPAKFQEDLWFQAGGWGFPGESGRLRFRAEFSTTEPPSPCAGPGSGPTPSAMATPISPPSGSGTAPGRAHAIPGAAGIAILGVATVVVASALLVVCRSRVHRKLR